MSSFLFQIRKKIRIAATTPINAPMQPIITLIRCCPMLLAVECFVEVLAAVVVGMTAKKIICKFLLRNPTKLSCIHLHYKLGLVSALVTALGNFHVKEAPNSVNNIFIASIGIS